MKKISIILIAILILLSLAGCENKNNVKEIKAEYFTISYGKSIYEAKDKVEQEKIAELVESYNNIKLNGITNQTLNFDQAITIIFINNDQISGQVTIDDKGICRVEDRLENYIISDESNIYVDALRAYRDLKRKYE